MTPSSSSSSSPSPSPLTFPTPLPQSPRSPILTWPLPPPYSHLVLTGKSRAAWHTSFMIPQLNLLLDAGLCVSDLRPKHVFLTHGHADHSLLAFAFVSRADPPDVVVPEGMRAVFDEYVRATTMMNLGGEAVDDNEQDEDEGDVVNESSSSTTTTLLHTHVTHGVRHGDIVPLRRLKDTITAEVFSCDHTVPCVGYVFRKTTHRLHPAYRSLPGPELACLRRPKPSSSPSPPLDPPLTEPHTTPIFAFLGDTTAKTLADSPTWLAEGIPVVITECSFLREEHRVQAERTKHTLWADLEPVIRRWPRTTFVLMHFSLRYKDEDVRAFFKGLDDPPRNMVVWVDGEDGGPMRV